MGILSPRLMLGISAKTLAFMCSSTSDSASPPPSQLLETKSLLAFSHLSTQRNRKICKIGWAK